jgi:poly(hydroxyalkanoate) granule-associated protein
MSSKKKGREEAASDSQVVAEIRESANQIWLAGLGAFARAREEGMKTFDALVKEGEAVQDRAKKAADNQIEEVRAKATGTWEKLEKVFEDRVERALHSLSVPTSKDIDSLSRRVADLTKITKKLLESMPASEKPSSSSAKKRKASAKTPETAA